MNDSIGATDQICRFSEEAERRSLPRSGEMVPALFMAGKVVVFIVASSSGGMI
jgi:hypothetical protein